MSERVDPAKLMRAFYSWWAEHGDDLITEEGMPSRFATADQAFAAGFRCGAALSEKPQQKPQTAAAESCDEP